jgi:hypothetical protein
MKGRVDMARQGRAVRNYVDRKTREWQCVAAIVELQAAGKRATAHSIAKKLGVRPSTHLRRLLTEVCLSIPGGDWRNVRLKNGVLCREFQWDTDYLREESIELWDTLALFVPLQYPMYLPEGDNDILSDRSRIIVRLFALGYSMWTELSKDDIAQMVELRVIKLLFQYATPDCLIIVYTYPGSHVTHRDAMNIAHRHLSGMVANVPQN